MWILDFEGTGEKIKHLKGYIYNHFTEKISCSLRGIFDGLVVQDVWFLNPML